VGLSRPVFPSGFRARPRLATFDRQANLNHGLREINMAYDKTISPIDWYFGSYLLRFVEIDEPGQNDPDRRFVAWENTVLVKAKSMDSAYTKVERIGEGRGQAIPRRSQGRPRQVGICRSHPTRTRVRAHRGRRRDRMGRSRFAKAQDAESVGEAQARLPPVTPAPLKIAL
jgi:hypothetical protein